MNIKKFCPISYHLSLCKRLVIAALLGVMMLHFGDVYAGKSNDEIEKKIKKLEKNVAKLNKKLNSEIKKNKKHKKKYSKLPKISGLFQQDVDVYSGAYHADLSGNTASDMFVRRARLGVSKKHIDWSYFFLLDFSNDEDFQSELIMARLRYNGFKFGPTIDFGKIREDISLEALSSSTYINTLSRSMLANAMSPYFNWGVSMNQLFESSGIRYALGVYKARGFGSSGKDENNKIIPAVTARLSWAPFREDGRVLHFGLWGTQRKFGDNVTFSLRDRAEVREADTRLLNYASGGGKFAIEKLTQAGFEFAVVFNSFTLQSEYAEKKVEASENSNDNTYEGKYVNVSYFITGEKMLYNSKSATLRSPKPISNLGAWEVVVRSSEFDARSDTQGTMVTANTLGINYHYSKKLKFMLNYIDSKVSGPGADALVGTHENGEAYTLRIHYAF